LAPRAKGAQNGGETVGFFVTGTMNSHLFVTGKIGMKFGQKRQSLSSIVPSLKNSGKIALNGVILHKTTIFGLL